MNYVHRLAGPWGAFLCCLLLALALSAVQVARASFQSTYCNTNAGTQTSTLTRDGAQTYSNIARYEGYQWGGGCWNNDDIDAAPNDPPQQYTGGEGGDCSGLTFKTWKESSSYGGSGIWIWDKLRNIHGPYATTDFRAYAGPNASQDKTTAGVMDAFASTSHMGMVFFRADSGSDQIVEALGESYGTNIWTETYRSNSNYAGIRRVGWTG